MVSETRETDPVEEFYRCGVDIGGTFTDCVVISESSGEMWLDKVLTTKSDPSDGFMECVERLTKRLHLDPVQIRSIVHATTVATNALLEREGAKTALLVTKGFGDILEIARQIRYELYNLQTEKVRPLVPRRLCFEIPERVAADGKILWPLEEQAIKNAAAEIVRAGVDSVAVCFLHSYQNSEHEKRAGALIRSLYPALSISLSSELAPEIREYWRASTAVTNAYIAPLVSRYIDSLENKLSVASIRGPLRIMQSSGGVMTPKMAKARPVYMLESGPAAGVMAAAYFMKDAGDQQTISFDMGGTTAKIGLVIDGRARIISEFEAGAKAGTGALTRGSGYPVLTPVIDLVEVGAGGGSLAWIDQGGLLRVGPQSAGSEPGPACYGRGGTRPTVTDANLVLGRLNPDYFLGGRIRLDAASAHDAIESHCARALDLTVPEAAQGILEIANARMADAMHLMSVQRGYDPAESSLFALGGAGPLHANSLARTLGFSRVIIPPSPGVASALGMLVSAPRMEKRITRIQPLQFADLSGIQSTLLELEREIVELLGEDSSKQIDIRPYLDLRYVGQSWTLRIELKGGTWDSLTAPALREGFHAEHEKVYGYRVAEEPIEVVHVGVTGTAPPPRIRLKELAQKGKESSQARKGCRAVLLDDESEFQEVPIYDRYALHPGNRVTGPAVIEEMDSTVVVQSRFAADVLQYGLLAISELQAERTL
jgi:N-methylhydantoinase A/oxoprolinase/acetone carboxylase beta subunit